MQISNLESELGVVLLDRSSKPIVPTEVGLIILEHAKDTIASFYGIKEQINSIKKIESKKGLRFLSDKLYETAVIRLENPEANLIELAELMDPPMKKSGINNRLKKIEEIAKKI
jgi:hypothetical protein